MTSLDRTALGTIASALRAERRALAAESFRGFVRIYLREATAKPDSRLHHDLYPMLQSLPQNPTSRIAIAAPRGSAKTTLMSTLFVLWAVCLRKFRYIVLISDTAEKAAGFLRDVKRELVDNDRLRADFPEVCERSRRQPGPPRWRENEIITHNDVKITALGCGQNIRGRRHRQDRPDLIILDDVESPENTRSQEARARLDEWFHKAILKAGTPQTSLVVAGTIQHYDSLLAKLTDPLKSPLWKGAIYRSVIQWSEHPELWQTWACILRGQEEFEGEVGANAARRYFEANSDAMLSKTEVLWPEREDYYTLMLMRESEGPASFDSEKQNEPVNPQDCLFLESDFQFWDDRFANERELLAALGDNARWIGACDPSLGKLGKHADDSAIIMLVWDASTGDVYVLDADIRRRKPDQIIEDILALTQFRPCIYFGMETVQFQEFLATEVERRSALQGRQLTVEQIRQTTDKRGRIQALQPLIRSGNIQFSRRHTLLLEQLRLFPKASHDDGPDALEMAVRMVDLVAAPPPEPVGLNIVGYITT